MGWKCLLYQKAGGILERGKKVGGWYKMSQKVGGWWGLSGVAENGGKWVGGGVRRAEKWEGGGSKFFPYHPPHMVFNGIALRDIF